MKQTGKKLTVLVMLLLCAFVAMDFPPVLSNAEELIDITEDEKLEITGLEDVVYNGKNQEQNIQVKYNGETLREDTDYYCLYSNHKNAGTAMIRIVGKGNYTGFREVTFNIQKAIPDYTINSGIIGTYGDTIADILLPKRENGEFTWNEDLSASAGEPGNHNFSLKFTPNDLVNYEVVEEILVTVEIFQRDISEAVVTGIEDTVYQAEAVVYEPVLTIGETVLELDKDYEISFSNNTNAGTALVTMKGLGNYTGTIQQTFTIEKADPDYGEVKVLQAVYRDCLGDVVLPSRENGTFLWEYSNSMSVGEAGVNTSFTLYFVPNDKSNYNIIREIPVEIHVEKKDVSMITISETKTKTYTGEGQEQNLYLLDGEVKLVKDRDFITVYENNINAGIAKVTIKGVGNYTGEKTLEFRIEKAVPKYEKITMLEAVYGQTLGDVVLPEDENGTFVFVEPEDTLVGNVGINKVELIYQPKDSGNYKTVENIGVSMKVQALDLSKAVVSGVTDGVATGREVKPEVLVELEGKKLVKGVDYSVGYGNNVYPGKAAVVVKGIGNYTGKIVNFYQVLE